jgi:hypothetical protein
MRHFITLRHFKNYISESYIHKQPNDIIRFIYRYQYLKTNKNRLLLKIEFFV